jgi:hypothetical protein
MCFVYLGSICLYAQTFDANGVDVLEQVISVQFLFDNSCVLRGIHFSMLQSGHELLQRHNGFNCIQVVLSWFNFVSISFVNMRDFHTARPQGSNFPFFEITHYNQTKTNTFNCFAMRLACVVRLCWAPARASRWARAPIPPLPRRLGNREERKHAIYCECEAVGDCCVCVVFKERSTSIRLR